MNGINKAIILGTLGQDPETRYLPSGEAVTNIRVATTERWKDKASGEEKEATEWHRIVFFGRIAEVAGEYLKKASKCYVEGKFRTRKWQDKDGRDRYTTEIVADKLQLLDSKPRTGEPEKAPEQAPATQRGAPGRDAAPAAKKLAGKFDDMEDDIPF